MRTLVLLLLFALNASASVYHIINEPLESVQARYSVLKSAKKYVYSSKFIFKNDEMGYGSLFMFRSRVRKLKKQGITLDVRLLIDAIGSPDLPYDVLMHLLDEGVKIKVYNNFKDLTELAESIFTGKLSVFYKRMHDKLLITDDKYLISGGRNIENAYYGLAEKNYVDRDVLVTGKPVITSRDHFLKMWNNTSTEGIEDNLLTHTKCIKTLHWKEVGYDEVTSYSKCLKTLKARGKRILDNMQKKSQKMLKQYEIDENKTVSQIIEGEDKNVDVTFYSDSVTKNGFYESKLADVIFMAAASAQESLIFESPYFIPEKVVIGLFDDLLHGRDIKYCLSKTECKWFRRNGRKVKITIITNSLASTDGLEAFAGYSKYRKELANLGPKENKLNLYEYNSGELGHYLHAKSGAVDGKVAMIGSYNVDPRSRALNTEVMLLAKSEKKARELQDSFDLHIEHSTKIGLNGNPNGGDEPYPNASTYKKTKVKAYHKILKIPYIGDIFEQQL